MLKRKVLKLLTCVFFIAAGTLHLLKPDTYLKIMPPYVPFPLGMVYASGVCEMVFGLGLLSRKTSRLAGWGLIALLVAVFPANLHMALHPELFPEIPTWVLWVRLPLQGLLVLWVYKVADWDQHSKSGPAKPAG